jgi:hypothetical protein
MIALLSLFHARRTSSSFCAARVAGDEAREHRAAAAELDRGGVEVELDRRRVGRARARGGER